MSEQAPISDSEFNYFRAIAHREAGISIADFKRNMVFRRVSKRVRALGLGSIREYRDYLTDQNWDRERGLLINALTTNKTSFFRENHHFEYLQECILPSLVDSARKSGNKRLRAWSAGSSSGEEAYSTAMTWQENIMDLASWDARILATDIDTDMVEHGERGVYSNEFLDDIPRSYRAKYLGNHSEDEFCMSAGSRGLTTFKPLNLLEAWPVKGPFDMIFCRNVMIYFDKPTKAILLDRFADLLKPDGHLFIGHSESLFKVTERFQVVGQNVYRRTK